MRGAWIEIRNNPLNWLDSEVAPHAGGVYGKAIARYIPSRVAPHAGGVDRNLLVADLQPHHRESLPMRGAWIEIRFFDGSIVVGHVAPHAGGVDRNIEYHPPDLPGVLSLHMRGAWL